MIVPMMYYLHDNFFPFVDNWVDNCNGRLVVPGLGAYRMLKEEADWTVNDITDQIDYSRYYGGAGCTFFRCANILDNTKGIYDELKDKYYKYPAQLPPLSWLDDTVPAAPEEIRVKKEGNELKLAETGFGKGRVDLYRLLFADGFDQSDIRPKYLDDRNPGYLHLSACRYDFGAGIYIFRFIFHSLSYRKRAIERNLLLSF